METITKYDVRKITWPEKVFITKRATVAFDQLTTFFSESYGEMYGLIQRLGIQANDPPCAIYYSIDEAKMETDLAAAVPVDSNLPELKEYTTVEIPPSEVIMTTHFGSYDNMGPAYNALETYLTDHALKRELIIEEYLSDPAVEKDPTNWKTNIYFVIGRPGRTD